MAASNQVYIGDVGTIISLDTTLTPTFLATATVVNIEVQKPDRSTVTWVSSIVGSSVEYSIQPEDLNTAGAYKLQVYLKTPTWEGRGTTVSMKVLGDFK